MKQSRCVKSNRGFPYTSLPLLSNASPLFFRYSGQTILAWGQFDPGVLDDTPSKLAASPGHYLPPFSLRSRLLLRKEMPKSSQSHSNLLFSPYGMWGLGSRLSLWQAKCLLFWTDHRWKVLFVCFREAHLLIIVMGYDLVRILKCGLLKPTTP